MTADPAAATFGRRLARRRIGPFPVWGLVLLAFGTCCLYGAVGIWLGVDRAVHGHRVTGTVSDIQCLSHSCVGRFTSADGTLRRADVLVDGAVGHRSHIRGVFVAHIATGLSGTVQSRDTVYVDRAPTVAVGSVLMGAALSVLGGLICGLFLLAGLMAALRRGMLRVMRSHPPGGSTSRGR